MIFCLIWLLSYEGSISNAFIVWRNIATGIAVILVLMQRHKQSSEGSGCTIRTIVLCQRSWENKHPMLSNRPLFHSFSLLQWWTRLNPLNNLWSFKSLIFWWTSASDEMLLTNLLLMTSSLQEHFSSDASRFNLVDSFALFCSFRTL